MEIHNKNFDRKMMEIGYIGAFYGMANQAQTIFSFYQDERFHDRSVQIAAKLGAALTFIGEHNYSAAAKLLEKDLAEFKDEQFLEAKVFLALIYKKAKIRSDRVEALLGELKVALSRPITDAVKALAAR